MTLLLWPLNLLVIHPWFLLLVHAEWFHFHCPSIWPHSINFFHNFVSLDYHSHLIGDCSHWNPWLLAVKCHHLASTVSGFYHLLCCHWVKSFTVISGLQSTTTLLFSDSGVSLTSWSLMALRNCLSSGPSHGTCSSHHLPAICVYPFQHAYFPELLPSPSFCHGSPSISTSLSMVYLSWLSFYHLWNSTTLTTKSWSWSSAFSSLLWQKIKVLLFVSKVSPWLSSGLFMACCSLLIFHYPSVEHQCCLAIAI